MRTMAGVWFSVIVLISIQNVFGNVCQKTEKDYNCDECMRCNGHWCRNPKSTPHCTFSKDDDWCPNDEEYPSVHEEAPNQNISGIFYAEMSLLIKTPGEIFIPYLADGNQELKMEIMNTTQTSNIVLKNTNTKCSESSCTSVIKAEATRDFCNATGGVTESVYVRFYVGLRDVAYVKYYVTCACECSLKMVKNSPICNKNGDFACGACMCHPGWEGEYCKQPKRSEDCSKRGDLAQCSLNPRRDDDCFGNGYCDKCETCVCYTDREGSQYFDKENNCEGLCDVANEFEECLMNNTIGECSKSTHPMTLQRYNETLTKEMDEQSRKIWVKCNANIEGCGQIEYYATRDTNGDIFVMMLSPCHIIDPKALVGNPNGMILGIVGLLAIVAAGGGVVIWKFMNTVPPVPLNDPQYQNIDAEDCTGENPLYKPPTSSFKNPTYGKW